MSEAADELERMAEELKRLSSDAMTQRDSTEDSRDKAVHVSVAATYADSAWRLRQRAAEFRQQRSGPTYKPQPKPDAVRAGQWWLWNADNGTAEADPLRIKIQTPRFKSDDPTTIGIYMSDGTIADVDDEEFLTDSDWLYLGDDERPSQNA